MMIRKLMASSALAALMAAGTIGYAGAQTSPATEQPPAEATTTQTPDPAAPDAGAATGADSAAMPADAATTDSATAGATGETNPTLTPDEPTLASAFMGRAVYSSEDPEADNIGEVNDLIVSDDGSITHAVVGVGGFLGIGEKNVSVPFDELEVVEREGDIRLIYAATREQLEAAEEFDRTAYDPAARAEPATGDLASAPMGGGAPMGGSDPMAGGAPADPAATDMAAAPVEPATDMAAAPAESAPDAAAPAEATTTADATAPADTATGADANASADMSASLPGSEAEFVSIGEGQIRASTMLGKEVYGQDEESIGEVADLVLQDDGETRAAIIDVGGFLGVGEKRVAVPFNEIQTAQEGEEVRLTVAMTREQLEQAPEYIEPDMTAASTDTATAPATDMAAGTDASGTPATDATGAPATDMAAAPADPNAPDQVQTDGSAGMEYELASQELTADNLIGTAVYSPNEENLGDVGDVVFDQAGSIQAVVIDVGGFLGIGEKPVAVQYDALNVQKGENGDLRIVVNATQEQLEGAPAFDEAPAQ